MTTNRDLIIAAISRPPRLPTPLDTEERKRIVGELLSLDAKIATGVERVVRTLERSDAAHADLDEAERDLVALLAREAELERQGGIERAPRDGTGDGSTCGDDQ